jgi:hypothetical protein
VVLQHRRRVAAEVVHLHHHVEAVLGRQPGTEVEPMC